MKLKSNFNQFTSMSSISSFSLLLLLFLISSFHLSSSSSPLTAQTDRYLKTIPSSLRQNISDEYFELTKPLPANPINPNCSLLLLQNDFGYTFGSPPVSVLYSPPSDCPGPWNQIILEFSASCQGEQYDRISGVWLEGVEILRTSTAEPTESGIFWKVRKDVTRYSSLFVQPNLTLSVMLENIVNEVFTGVYNVNVSLNFYGVSNKLSQVTESKFNRKLGLLPQLLAFNPIQEVEDFAVTVFEGLEGISSGDESKKLGGGGGDKLNGHLKSVFFGEKPADLIIPISNNEEEGLWFRIENESDVKSKGILIPNNTRRAVLEIYVSFHGNDEFWYSNPPDSYILANNLTTQRGNGAFRQVFATIDGAVVGSTTPFPVIFTGGINPLFWEPVVGIGAFNLPSYDLDLTPFLGLLVDGKEHLFGLGVNDSLPFWLVDANLHLWLDQDSSNVEAKSVSYQTSPIKIKRETKFRGLDGSFEIQAKRKTEFNGWVNSSTGNFTTRVVEEFKFKNEIKFNKFGQEKEVEQKIKVKTEVYFESDTGVLLKRTITKRKYPLKMLITTLPGPDNNTYLSITNVSHSFNEKTTTSYASSSNSDQIESSVSNSQKSGGWMLIQDHSVLSGSASTSQSLSYKDKVSCYSRNVAASNGKLLEDITGAGCNSSS